jgi:hypothetical protein
LQSLERVRGLESRSLRERERSTVRGCELSDFERERDSERVI